jgi:hypothetical protein
MAKNLIGHTKCPDCGHNDAEVALDKKGNPYRVCLLGECDGAQFFTHGKPGRVKNLLAKTRPVAGVELVALAKKFNVELPAPSSAPAKDAPAEPVKKKAELFF